MLLNNFYESQGVAKFVVFCPFLVRLPIISLSYREYFIAGLINQFLVVKIKTVYTIPALTFQMRMYRNSVCSFHYY